jgi:hypothetical protein
MIAVTANQDADPLLYNEAVSSADRKQWESAMQDELDSLAKNHTWRLTDLPRGRRALQGRWVYRKKIGQDGSVTKFKARWVAKGFEQQYGVDFDQTYASVVKPMSYKTLFAIAAAEDWEIEQMDVRTAFLQGELEEEVYVEQPTGFKKDNRVCLLNKALYGLKQSPRTWYKTIAGFFKGIGFHPTHADPAIFCNSDKIVIAIYVDDLLIFGPNIVKINQLKKSLSERFDMSDLGPCTYYLGMQITRDRASRRLKLDQTQYLIRVLDAFNMTDCKPVATPMEMDWSASAVDLTYEPDAEFKQRYQSAIGSLMYAMVETRPDLALAVSRLSQFSAKPTEAHWKAVKRVFRYIKGTLNYGITYSLKTTDDGQIYGYSDSDWGGDKATRRSTGGYVFFIAGGAVSWSSKRQQTVALSSCESEYMALTQATKEAIWFKRLLSDLEGITRHSYGSDRPIRIHADNQGANSLTQNPTHHSRSKHIDIQYHFTREKVESGEVEIEYVSTDKMVADGLTKALGGVKFGRFIQDMKLNYNEA